MALLRNLSQFYEGQPFSSQPSINRRYHFENDNFRYGEALILYSMLRHLRPKRLVEIGSGYSSAVSLDTNDLFLDGSVKCLFIDPFPQLLLDLIESHPVKGHLKIVADEVQNTDDTYFSELEENDVVFIDSTHVSKIGSDVNYLIFSILPLLRKGVYIHFHDVYYPFEYPSDWIYQGRAWNEAYLLRAFLQCNASYRIAIFNSYLAHHHLEVLLSQMPLCQYGVGSSLWLVKVS